MVMVFDLMSVRMRMGMEMRVRIEAGVDISRGVSVQTRRDGRCRRSRSFVLFPRFVCAFESFFGFLAIAVTAG